MLKLFISLSVLLSTVVQAISNYPLVNQNGKPFQLYDLKGSYVFMSFIYTRCPIANMCPLTVTLNKSVFRKWKALKTRVPLQFVFVTLDPATDTPEVLKKFATTRALDPKTFTLVTGNEQTLSDLASQFNVVGFPSDGMISHNIKSVLLDPELNEVKQFKENEWKPEEVVPFLSKPPAKPQG